MRLNWIALAVPFFLIFIGLEYFFSLRKGKRYFRLPESIANLNVGIGERLADLFTTTFSSIISIIIMRFLLYAREL